ncbi:mRNA decay activator protein ZFP36L2-A-like [Limulus polyphemus]|uniref:mRNA decay activator protein ZFP36L2-A-like n=1 Tax=Limulus polyphemus TaxID=6850 RepID=A0ABM1C595_LIMPO|nr:mRNA decay activator protein ZFP36L2-A-like [Limulus polyphemus]
MSTAMVTTLYDYSDILYKKPNIINTNKTDFPLDRRPISPSTIFNFQSFRRNSANHLTSVNISPPSPKSIGMHQKPGSPALPVCSNSIPNVCTSNNIFNLSSGGRELRKLDRTFSDPVERSNAQAKSNQTNSSRYKTELCRPFEENGTCKYGDKCQFAHGNHELRTLSRHPKYKTELCRTFHTTGLCPYGSRCHFIHYSEETRKSLFSNLQVGMNTFNLNECPSTDQGVTSRPKALSLGSFSLDSAGDSSPPSSMSGSPTSLNSFFNDDTFGNFSPTFQSNPLSNSNTAFSFSQDFTSLMSTLQQQAHLSPFGGSQPVTTPAVFARRGLTSPNSEIMDSTVREQLYSVVPPAPPSPVDSITSELDGLSLASSPGMATCSSPLDVNRTLFRLPIFSSLANFD